MKKTIHHIGMDVHKNSIAVAIPGKYTVASAGKIKGPRGAKLRGFKGNDSTWPD